MENLTEIQKLRAAIAAECNFDINKAKPIFNFIMGNEPVVTVNPAIKSDGIYYVLKDQSLIQADEMTAKRDDIIGVAVKQGDKIATVALHDAADGEKIALCMDSCGTSEFFHQDFWDAITDWDGEGNTKDIMEALNPKINLQPGQYIPSVAQLHLILMHIKDVNQALEAAGGTPMRKEWYWTSTEYSANNSLVVYFYSGPVYGTYYHKCHSSVVRPAVAHRV